MKLKQHENLIFNQYTHDIINSSSFQEMKNYIQHGKVCTYDHCVSVSYYSFYIVNRLKIKCNHRSLIRGALLHDYYLYDWHHKDRSHRWHGFHHPKKASHNASLHFQISELEKNIIISHMWPLTFKCLPKGKEAIIVCGVDKVCSLLETFHII